MLENNDKRYSLKNTSAFKNTTASHDCLKNFNHEPYLCNGCNDLMQKAMNFNDIVIVPIKGNDYRIHFWI